MKTESLAQAGMVLTIMASLAVCMVNGCGGTAPAGGGSRTTQNDNSLNDNNTQNTNDNTSDPQQQGDPDSTYADMAAIEGTGTREIEAQGVTGDTTFDVTFKSGTRFINEKSMMDYLIRTSDDGAILYFDPAVTSVRELNVGETVLFAGLSVNTILDIREEGGELVVETQRGTLANIVQDGTIGWNAQLNMAEAPDWQISSDIGEDWEVEILDPELEKAGTLKSDKKFRLKYKNWTIEMEFSQPGNDKLEFKIVGKHKYGGSVNTAAFAGKGFIANNLSYTSELQFENGELVDMNTEHTNLSGEVEIEFAAFNDQGKPQTEIFEFKIPIEVPFIIQAGPIPIVLTLKAEARFVPELRTDSTSSAASFKITFDGMEGLAVKDGQIQSFGSFDNINIELTGETISAGPSLTTGVGCGLEFPKVEATILGFPGCTYVALDTYVYSLFRPGLLMGEESCQCGGVKFKALTGYKLDVFGLFEYEDKITTETREWEDCVDGVKCD